MFVKITLILLIIINSMTVNCWPQRKLITFVLDLLARDRKNVEVSCSKPFTPYKLSFFLKDRKEVANEWAKFSRRNYKAQGSYESLARYLRSYYRSNLIGKCSKRYQYWIDLNHDSFNQYSNEIDDRNKLLKKYFSKQEPPTTFPKQEPPATFPKQEPPTTDSITEYHPEGNQGPQNTFPQGMAEQATHIPSFNTEYPAFEKLNSQARRDQTFYENHYIPHFEDQISWLIDPSSTFTPSTGQQANIIYPPQKKGAGNASFNLFY